MVEDSVSKLTILDQVDKIITDEQEARDEGAKGAVKPPVVIGVDQNKKKVSHKPETVSNVSAK